MQHRSNCHFLLPWKKRSSNFRFNTAAKALGSQNVTTLKQNNEVLLPRNERKKE